MTITSEYLVFQHLKEHCSDKIVQKFCKELNFNPPTKKNGAKITIDQVVTHYQQSSSPQDVRKKRKNSEDSTDIELDETVPKRSKIDLSTIECYKCYQTGHMSRECPQNEAVGKPKMDLSTTECYKCHQTGHMSRECPQNEAAGKPKMDLSNTECYKCHQTGHMSRECPQNGGKSYESNDDVDCYNCNKAGHFSKNCPEKFAGLSCYNCGKSGHLSRECPTKATGMKCYNCGNSGHLSRDCKEKNGANSKMQCYNCQSVGHMARDCDKPKVQRQQNGFGRGGGGNKSWKPRTFGTGANDIPIGPKKNAS